MIKLIGDVFKDQNEYNNFIVDAIHDKLVYPDKIEITISNTFGKSMHQILLENGESEENIESTDALFIILNDPTLEAAKKGLLINEGIYPESLAMLVVFNDRIEASLNKLQSKYLYKDYINFILYHECRHAQQFFYILDKYKDKSLYYDIVDFTKTKDEFDILELDANIYANNLVKNKILDIEDQPVFELKDIMELLIVKLNKNKGDIE